MPGARAPVRRSVRQSPWGWGLSLAPPGGSEGSPRTQKGGARLGCQRGAPQPSRDGRGLEGARGRRRWVGVSREGDWRAKSADTAVPLGAPASPLRSHPDPPVPGSSPLAGVRPSQHSAPCLQGPSREPGWAPPGPAAPPHTRASPRRASAPPAARGGAAGGAGQLPTPRSRRSQPPPRRGEAPCPARRGPRPPQPSPSRHCSDTAGRAQRLGVQPAAAEHPPSTMAVQASPAQSRRAAHSAASQTPAGAPAFFFFSLIPHFSVLLPGGWLGWAPPALPRFTSWLLHGIRAEPERQRLAACARRPGCRAGGARTLTAARAPLAPARAPPSR